MLGERGERRAGRGWMPVMLRKLESLGCDVASTASWSHEERKTMILRSIVVWMDEDAK